MNTLNKKKIICAILLAMVLTWPVCRGIHHIKRFKIVRTYRYAHESLVEKYLFGKSGIEIGGHWINDFHLYEHGPYLNVDFTMEDFFNQNGKMRKVDTVGQEINVVANGDDLPFKDNTFDYVFTSHVMEHFFDPIKAIKEHLRVIKKGGYLLYIIPNPDIEVNDHERDITGVDELMKRHNHELSIRDYYKIERDSSYININIALVMYSVLKSKIDNMPGEYFTNNIGKNIKKSELKTFDVDYHHHWNVWRVKDFLELAKSMGLNVVDWKEKDDNLGNGFVVVIQK